MKKILNFIIKNKKGIIVVCCVFVIGVSVFSDYMINRRNITAEAGSYLYNSNPSESAKILGEAKLVDSSSVSEDESDSYFANALINRKRSRDEALETLQVVIDSSESMPDVKDEALDRMIDIASEIEIEALVEEMIKAKGFSECLAVISGDNINVVVKSPGLLTNEVAQITEIVMEETGLSPENIRIVEKN